jgi:hypothetical protein
MLNAGVVASYQNNATWRPGSSAPQDHADALRPPRPTQLRQGHGRLPAAPPKCCCRGSVIRDARRDRLEDGTPAKPNTPRSAGPPEQRRCHPRPAVRSGRRSQRGRWRQGAGTLASPSSRAGGRQITSGVVDAGNRLRYQLGTRPATRRWSGPPLARYPCSRNRRRDNVRMASHGEGVAVMARKLRGAKARHVADSFAT